MARLGTLLHYLFLRRTKNLIANIIYLLLIYIIIYIYIIIIILIKLNLFQTAQLCRY